MRQAPSWPVYGTITGPLVVIGFGSIGKGTLPLIERHFNFDKTRVDDYRIPSIRMLAVSRPRGYRYQKAALTKENYKEILKPILSAGGGQGFVVNLSVDTSSLDLMKFCRKLGVLYLDTVVEPWLGFYFDDKAKPAERTNYALREAVRKEKRRKPGGTTAISCCGANPGMVSWFVKQALGGRGHSDRGHVQGADQPQGLGQVDEKNRGSKGSISRSATRNARRTPKPIGAFWNTWSVEGFLSEGFQPAELGWGTHETWKPNNAKSHKKGCNAAIYLEQPGANTRVRSWCPDPGTAIRVPGNA